MNLWAPSFTVLVIFYHLKRPDTNNRQTQREMSWVTGAKTEINTPPDNKALLFKLDVNLSQTEKHKRMKGALLTARRLSFSPHQEMIIMWKVILLSGTFTPTSCHQHSCFSRVNKGLEEEWQVVSSAERGRRLKKGEKQCSSFNRFLSNI